VDATDSESLIPHRHGQNVWGIAIGRKNWLHLGSKEAGPKIAALFSIVESCRKLGVPIRQYLADVLPGLADRSIQSLGELTPAAYAAKMAK
jgi:transposase